MKDVFYIRLAGLLPKRLLYWCAINVWVETSTGEYAATQATEITCCEAVARFRKFLS